MSPIFEVVWKQPPETPVNQHKLDSKCNEYASNTNQTTQELGNKQITDVASQASPPKGFQLQSSRTATEQFREKSRNEQVILLDNSNSCPTDIQDSREHIMTTRDGDSSKSPRTPVTPHIEERLVRDEKTKELYLPLTSTVVLKRKQELLNLPLDFEKNLTIDALIDSRAYVSANAQDELDTIKKGPQQLLQN